MARSRMIKPEFWDDEKLATQTSRDARLTFIGLWNHSDDYGTVKGNTVWLKNHIFPYEDSLSIQVFKKWLTELEKGRWIIPFHDKDEKYYYIRNFNKHQTINRPSKQRNPVPPDRLNEDSLSIQGALIDETETETETETEYIPDSFFKFSQKFYAYLQSEYPEKKIDLSNGKIKKGADAVRLLVEKDGFDLDKDIRPALMWALKDDFWQAQVNSLAELRKKKSGAENHKFYNLYQIFKAESKDQRKVNLEW